MLSPLVVNMIGVTSYEAFNHLLSRLCNAYIDRQVYPSALVDSHHIWFEYLGRKDGCRLCIWDGTKMQKLHLVVGGESTVTVISYFLQAQVQRKMKNHTISVKILK